MHPINSSNRALVLHICLLLPVVASFVISGGQIFTPGLAVLDAPQPGTPLGGDLLEVALDVTANGRLGLPPYPDGSPTRINNITIFLSSYDTGRNLTISDGGVSSASAGVVGDIMASEDGSTVKHVKWIWPDCLIGDGQPENSSSDRGTYNISIRQNFQLNGSPHYTIFDVPISVTNRIDSNGENPSCDAINNRLLTPKEIDAASANGGVGILFAPGDATEVQVELPGKEGEDDDGDDDGNNDDPGSDVGLGNPDLGGGDDDSDGQDIGLGKPESSGHRLSSSAWASGYLDLTICMCFLSSLALVA